MSEKKLYIIGKLFEKSSGGPANIVRGLIKNFELEQANYDSILLTENISKLGFIKKIFQTCMKSSGCIVNVHTDGFLIPLLVYIVSLVSSSNSYYLTVHGIYKTESRMEGKSLYRYILIEKLLYRHFPNLICVSEMLRKDIQREFGRKENVYVIPNATDAESRQIPDIKRDKLALISLGGLRCCKGIDHTIDLARLLDENGIPFELDVYGQPESKEQWFHNELITRKLEDKIHFCGMSTDRQNLYDMIAKADVQLCLSRYDTFNVAIAESLVLGCPVVSTNRCGASCWVEGDDGCIIDIDDWENTGINNAYEYIRKIYENRELRWNIYQSREKNREKLSWKAIVNAYASLD